MWPLILLTLLSSAPPDWGTRAPTTSQTAQTQSTQDRYDHCVGLVQIDPEQARRTAETWLNQGGGDKARYCAALADLGRGKAKLAGVKLYELAERSHQKQDEPRITAQIYAQAAEAFSTASAHQAALDAIDKALDLMPQSAALAGRAAIVFGAAEQWSQVIEALDRKQQTVPLSSQELTLRGRAHFSLGQKKQAAKDIWQALQLRDDNIDALILRGELAQSGVIIAPITPTTD